MIRKRIRNINYKMYNNNNKYSQSCNVNNKYNKGGGTVSPFVLVV